MKFVYTLSLFLVVLLPVTASAYTTTGQKAYRVNDTTALYYINYAFGHEHGDMYLPVLAKRNQEHGAGTQTLGYDIIQDDDFSTNYGTAQAVALANVPIVDGMYKIPKGYKAEFTLAVILTVPADTESTDYSVQVTDFPFYIETDGERMEQRLNPSELQYYATEGITLGTRDLADIIDSIDVEVTSIEYTAAD